MVGKPVEAEGSFPGRERLGSLLVADSLLGAGILLEARPGMDLLKKRRRTERNNFKSLRCTDKHQDTYRC